MNSPLPYTFPDIRTLACACSTCHVTNVLVQVVQLVFWGRVFIVLRPALRLRPPLLLPNNLFH